MRYEDWGPYEEWMESRCDYGYACDDPERVFCVEYDCGCSCHDPFDDDDY